MKYIENIGRGLLELMPVEIVSCEVCEAGSPLALGIGSSLNYSFQQMS